MPFLSFTLPVVWKTSLGFNQKCSCRRNGRVSSPISMLLGEGVKWGFILRGNFWVIVSDGDDLLQYPWESLLLFICDSRVRPRQLHFCNIATVPVKPASPDWSWHPSSYPGAIHPFWLVCWHGNRQTISVSRTRPSLPFGTCAAGSAHWGGPFQHIQYNYVNIKKYWISLQHNFIQSRKMSYLL